MQHINTCLSSDSKDLIHQKSSIYVYLEYFTALHLIRMELANSLLLIGILLVTVFNRGDRTLPLSNRTELRVWPTTG